MRLQILELRLKYEKTFITLQLKDISLETKKKKII